MKYDNTFSLYLFYYLGPVGDIDASAIKTCSSSADMPAINNMMTVDNNPSFTIGSLQFLYHRSAIMRTLAYIRRTIQIENHLSDSKKLDEILALVRAYKFDDSAFQK